MRNAVDSPCASAVGFRVQTRPRTYENVRVVCASRQHTIDRARVCARGARPTAPGARSHAPHTLHALAHGQRCLKRRGAPRCHLRQHYGHLPNLARGGTWSIGGAWTNGRRAIVRNGHMARASDTLALLAHDDTTEHWCAATHMRQRLHWLRAGQRRPPRPLRSARCTTTPAPACAAGPAAAPPPATVPSRAAVYPLATAPPSPRLPYALPCVCHPLGATEQFPL